MEFANKSFTIADPREFDGNPFEVAGRAVGQIAGLAALMKDSIEPVMLMARNAEMERQLQRGEAPDPAKWEQSAEGRRFAAICDELDAMAASLAALRRSAEFNPKQPPKA